MCWRAGWHEAPSNLGAGGLSLATAVISCGGSDVVDSSALAVFMQCSLAAVEKEKADLELAKRGPWFAQDLKDKKKMLERSWRMDSSTMRTGAGAAICADVLQSSTR